MLNASARAGDPLVTGLNVQLQESPILSAARAFRMFGGLLDEGEAQKTRPARG